MQSTMRRRTSKSRHTMYEILEAKMAQTKSDLNNLNNNNY